MQRGKFEPKKWQEDDVDIEISHCGVCGSDLHTLSSGWGPTPYPCVVGHEIVGKAVRVGSKVKHVSVGDRVGVGAQARSCLRDSCIDRSTGLENHCSIAMVNTYGSVYPNDEGKSYGGYAYFNRTNGHFVFKIPEGLDSADAAPMLCGGISVYSPLKANGCGPGKSVGIIGVGGLGHFGVLFARALGADRVVGISRKSDKAADARALGADDYIATSKDPDWASNNERSLGIIVCTVSSEKMPLTDYLGLLKAKGTFIQVGAPDGGNVPPVNAFTLIANGIKIGGSAIGAPEEIDEMLHLAAEQKIKPWVQKRSLKDANQVTEDFENGKARYRYVLVNEKHL
ncbi:GroES-like protein [Hortaea werneckii]|nr:GroES-like protein [Hortaea werneckii]KAI7592813.1 GroES-like protein [Hortaea werneckii]RMY03545.1 hypothetical protein D0868_07410 [Hortaea werneckii]